MKNLVSPLFSFKIDGVVGKLVTPPDCKFEASGNCWFKSNLLHHKMTKKSIKYKRFVGCESGQIEPADNRCLNRLVGSNPTLTTKWRYRHLKRVARL